MILTFPSCLTLKQKTICQKFAKNPGKPIWAQSGRSDLPENSVRSENTGVSIIREIMVATTMSSLFVAFFALVASSFRTRAALQAEILALRHQLATRRVACSSTGATGSCGLCWVVLTDSSPAGGDVSR